MIPFTKHLIPVQERVKYLYAVGYNENDIAMMINEEFKDITITEIGAGAIKTMIRDNKTEFDEAKLTFTENCRAELKQQVSQMFHKTSAVELRTVDVFVKKLDAVLDQLEDLDISDPENKGRFFSLLEAAERLQSRMATIAGTNAFRDIEIYRQKLQIKIEAAAQEKPPGHLPAMRDATPTVWIDD
jgi:hypothetical protein